MRPLPRLQFLTLDGAPLGHAEQARLALTGGVRWIQLRAKGLDPAAWTSLAREISAACRDFGAILTVNDSPGVALAAGVDGVHVGKTDASPAEARRLLGPRTLLGVTLNHLSDLPLLEAGLPDYAGVGPFRATSSKPGHAPVHVAESLAALITAARLPCYVIGGVTASDLPAIRALGAQGVALSASIARDPDPESAARRLVAAVGVAWGDLS